MKAQKTIQLQRDEKKRRDDIKRLTRKINEINDWLFENVNCSIRLFSEKLQEQNNLRFLLKKARRQKIQFKGKIGQKDKYHPKVFNPIEKY